MKYLSKISSLLLLLTASLFVFPSEIFAASNPPQITDGTLSRMFNSIMDLAYPIAGLIAFAMLVYGGYMWMIAAGDPGKIKQAQGTLTWAVIGLGFIAVFSLLVTQLLKFFGLV